MARERLVVIGGDAAGMSAASQARKRRDAVDTTARRVTARDLESGREYDEAYDQLVHATGGVPMRPRAQAGWNHPARSAIRWTCPLLLRRRTRPWSPVRTTAALARVSPRVTFRVDTVGTVPSVDAG